jgi:RNA 2',3'-cyclic 3'-phosphodiesterase
MPRVFFALQPTAKQSAELLADIEFRFSAQKLAAIPAGNLHSTLCFLGAVEAERFPALREAASRVRGRKVSLRFDALEYWAKPQIICATASPSGVVGADMLSRAISDEVIAAGFSPDIKPFRAHLTLARKVRASQAETLALICRPLRRIRVDGEPKGRTRLDIQCHRIVATGWLKASASNSVLSIEIPVYLYRSLC